MRFLDFLRRNILPACLLGFLLWSSSVYPAQWEFVNPPLKPAPRVAASLVYDSARDRLIMFGGEVIVSPSPTTLAFLNDLWEFDGTVWERIETNLPPPRSSVLSEFGIYIPVKTTTFYIGGWNPGDIRGPAGTWEYDPSLAGSDKFILLERELNRGAGFFDSVRNLLLSMRSRGRLEAFSNGSWNALKSTAPWGFPRIDIDLSYDTARSELVVFGGWDFDLPNRPAQSDTWRWNSPTNTWTQASPESSPPARARFRMLYHPNRGTHVLFGGTGDTWFTENPTFSDVWEFDPVADNWSEIIVTNPIARNRHSMAYDSVRDRVYVFGGRDASGNETNDLFFLNDLPSQASSSWQDFE